MFMIGVLVTALVLAAGWTGMSTASAGGGSATSAARSVPDPASPAPTATPSYEKTRSTKVDLIDQLTEAPGLLVLGSSRAMRVDPDHVRDLTGRSGFNCAVSSGSVADAYSFVRYIHDRFPDSTQRYLWLLDPEQFRTTRVHRAIMAIQRLGQYTPGKFWPTGVNPWPAPVPVPTPTPAIDAGEEPVARDTSTPVAGTTPDYGKQDVYATNGTVVWNMYDYTKGRTLKQGLKFTNNKYKTIYPKGFTKLRSVPKWFMENTLALMNSWGQRPVIVLTTYHPTLLTFIKGRTFSQRHTEILAYFRQLQAKYQFVLLDYTSIKMFGGWKSGFYDGVHPKSKLSNFIELQAVLASGGALQ